MDRPTGRGLRVAVLLDTAGFLRSLPLTGAAARTLHLNKHLHTLGCDTTLLLCDLNPRSRPTDSWPLPVRYLPPEAVYEQTDILAGQVKELAPDVLVMSSTQLVVRHGRDIARAVGCALVYELHDDEGALLRSIGGSRRQAQAATLLQRAAMAVADGVVAFTDRDAALVRSVRQGAVHVVPSGVEPDPPPDHSQPTQGRLAFIGNLYYEPNLRAVRYLRGTLAPALAPLGCVIDVFGRYPCSVRHLAEPGLVELRGPVPDLRAALATMAIGVAPLDSGGGMKLKVLEYMAAGLPVVATPEALTGLAGPQSFALVATQDQMAEFPELVAALLADQELRARLGAAGRCLAERAYSWRSMAVLARHAYGVILRGQAEVDHAAAVMALPADVVELASQPPFWLREFRSRQDPDQGGNDEVADFAAGRRDTVVGRLAESIDCARLAAESALGTTFDQDAVVGYGGRSMVFFASHAVLKVYTHRWSERLGRELAGLDLAARLPGLRVPTVLGHGDVAGSLAWLACSRLEGTLASDKPERGEHAAEQLGRVAARLHSPPAELLAGLPAFGRIIREVPATDQDAYRAAGTLVAALAGVEQRFRGRCAHHRGFVHGDFSSRNVLVQKGLAPGVIDFEGCGIGCVYEDLATLYLRDALLGGRSAQGLLHGYEAELAALGQREPDVERDHLLFHTGWYARWVLQWAVEIDLPMAAEVTRLVPRVLAGLEGDGAISP